MPRRDVEFEDVFTLSLPEGWEAERDEEEGLNVVGPEGTGLLHLIPIPQPEGEVLDPAEELYAFLEDQGVELEEDEVEDVELAEEDAELSLCEYLAEADEEEDDERATFWMIAVATAPGLLIFGSYSCPAGEEEAERAAVREILASLRPHQRP